MAVCYRQRHIYSARPFESIKLPVRKFRLLFGTRNNKNHTAAFFQLAAGGNFGNGTSDNSFSYVDSLGNTYRRKVGAFNASISYDQESGSLAPSHPPSFAHADASQMTFLEPRLPGRRDPLG